MSLPRQVRKQSASGVYHAMLRGINRQVIFEDDEDYEKLLQVLRDCKEVSHFKLYAYCLMSNHIHLLLRAGPEAEPLEQIFKRIGVRYVTWYNRKYARSGPLFQDRFKSEAVDDDAYLLTVLRYIHQNPVKAGLCKKPEKYAWSSYPSYLSGGELCATAEVLFVVDADPGRALEEFKKLHAELVETVCMDADQERRLSDAEVKTALAELCGTDQAARLQELPTTERDATIAALKEQGASLRQIVRLTGWPFGIVRSR